MAKDDQAGPTARRHTSFGGWLVQSRASLGPAHHGVAVRAQELRPLRRPRRSRQRAGHAVGAGALAVAAVLPVSTSPGLTVGSGRGERFFRPKRRWLGLRPSEVHDRQEVAAHAADAKERRAQPERQGDDAQRHEPCSSGQSRKEGEPDEQTEQGQDRDERASCSTRYWRMVSPRSQAAGDGGRAQAQDHDGRPETRSRGHAIRG